MSIDRIANEVLQLSPQDRAILAETLWESLEDPYVLIPDISDRQAITLSQQRNKEIEKGHAIPLSHKELMNKLRR